MSSKIPKLYFSIGEVSKRLGVEQPTLRYWETEFPQLKPEKNRAGNRVYKDPDLALLEQIRYLLYEEKFTIEGARQKLVYFNAKTDTPGTVYQDRSQPALTRDDLQALKSLLERLIEQF